MYCHGTSSIRQRAAASPTEHNASTPAHAADHDFRQGPAAQAPKAYHDGILAQGAPPVRFARQLLLDEPIE